MPESWWAEGPSWGLCSVVTRDVAPGVVVAGNPAKEIGLRPTHPVDTLKILSPPKLFSPRVGGIETVSALLATEFAKAGHEVKVVTKTKEDDHRA